MAKAFDLTNQRFGRLVALYKCDFKLNNHYPWFCQCDCGNTKVVRTQDLVRGKTTSCGCLQKEIVSRIGKKTGPIIGAKSAKDITNQRFGKLVALNATNERKESNIIWICQCDCGSQVKIRLHDLISGNTTSCGCIRSKGQYKIATLLTNNNISFVTEKTFDDLTYKDSKTSNPRFDFFVNNSYVIEYDGIQHFQENEFFSLSLQEQQKRDNIKNEWCKSHNIPIIRIPYTHLNKLIIDDLKLETSEFIIY